VRQHLLIKLYFYQKSIEGAVNDKGAFTLGSKVKITLALDENITLANVGSNKIVELVLPSVILLILAAVPPLCQLVTFVVIVANPLLFRPRFLLINFSSITDSVALSNESLDTDLMIGGGNKITHTNGGVYEKAASAGWNADVASSKGFINDGYVIAKLGNTGRVMLGLSSDDSSESNVNVNLISSPIVNTPLLLAAPLSIHEKTASAGWNADVASSKGFINDGYVIAKLGNTGRVMLGLSSDDSSDSYSKQNPACW
jgi:hypothetical protein